MRDFIFIILVSTHMSGVLSRSAGCHLWDGQCITALAKRITPSFLQSVYEVGTPDVDPILFNLIQIHEEGVQIVLEDVKIYGLNNLIIDHLSFDKLANNMSRTVFHTDFYITGHYKSNGTAFSLPVSGDGPFRAGLKNTEFEIIAQFDRLKDLDNQEYDNIKDFQFRYQVKDKADMQFENLYYGDEEASNRMHYIINTYCKLVVEVYGHKIMRLIADTFVKAVRVYLKEVPLSVMVTM